MALTRTLARRLVNYQDNRCLGARLRRARLEPLLEMIRRLSVRGQTVTLLDIGGTEQYWRIVPESFLSKHRVEITIANLAPHKRDTGCGHFRQLKADGCDLSLCEDRSFHLVHSNSVIEHVGDWQRMKRFAAEIARVGQGYFVQTPHYWFPMEPHCLTPCFHWLPRPWQLALVRRFALGNWKQARNLDDAIVTVDSARLLTTPMMAELFPDGELRYERILGLPKSILALRQPPFP
ncbi:methyltransferase domain-containing protein [Ferrimonas sp. YFM]|uniref:methyltransferase domain-containing protein n=1 Tax=Ferrimonas sp. YFM TaxID=3028878 RepID=UPI00257439F6|nr:methyltransferase domain-containing protein [Ferrimonas sp. YFM]BDY05706.1 hypothetical protein F0521_27470 [Ferrimonas sp. YFM]